MKFLSTDDLLCMFCSKNLEPKVDSLLAHNCKQMIDSPHYPYVCCICSSVANQVWKFRRHFLVHTKEKKFSCAHCTYRSCYLNDLKKHVRKHTGEKPYKCDLCCFTFTQASSLATHKKTHSKVNSKLLLRCKFCACKFYNEKNYNEHVMRYHSEKFIICQEISSDELTDFSSLDQFTIESFQTLPQI
ncbi:zinc finger protein 681-like [Diaphorina citri]|uniref:Zinc finger protein 681-like n=1 Tax=Diaphorina citri TaxID=121845 RepID=A0A1S4EM45_DIACI|nr:zinc finger protein 681-like [Diaphorina citri]